jgi:hypothetical protein
MAGIRSHDPTVYRLCSCDENFRKNHYLWPYMKDCSFITSFPCLTSLCLLRTLALATLSFEDAQGRIARVSISAEKF